MNVHQGIIKSFDYNSSDCSTDLVDKVRSALLGSRLQDIRDWYGFMESNIPSDQAGLSRVIKYLDEFLPIPSAPGS
jgi:lipoate-protein ligase A